MTPSASAALRVAVPFLKWAGGKSVIAEKIISRLGPIPPRSTYFEPFLGGGAIFFRLRPAKAVLLDSNTVLTRAYRVVKDEVESLITALDSMPPPSGKDDFETRRATFNALLPAPVEGPLTPDDITRSALLIWLNHTCYNGLFRVNKAGHFNVPYGYYERPFIFDANNLRAASTALRTADAQIIAGDYSLAAEMAHRGDVLYFDPPYQPPDESDGFTEYTSGGFGPKDQERLAAVVRQLVQRGCRPVVSNSNASDIAEMYSGLDCREMLVPRAINCNGKKRGKVVELLFFPKSRVTLHDLWESVVEQSGFDLRARSVFEVTSRRVKELTGQEPRLIAKMDTREELPHLLSSQGYFVLPVSSNRYALVPGDGYHDLESPGADPVAFRSSREVPVTVALKAGESAAIQTALYSGLLEEVVGVPRLRETLHNDMLQLKDAEIHYGDSWSLRINGARVELDAGFENHREFFLFECKKWYHSQLNNFNVRQLFFPYLHAIKDLQARDLDWKVRCFFLNVEPDTSIYRFWEYAFPKENDYSDMRPVRQAAFRLVQPRPSDAAGILEQLLQLPKMRTDYVPQANDPTKLLSLVQGVAEGIDTPPEVASRLRFVGRQSHYYGEAAEELGLIERSRGRFSLTAVGSQLSVMQTDDATHALVERIFTLPVFHEVGSLAVRNKTTAPSFDSLLPILRRCSHGRYNETTLRRRSQSVQRWLNWVGETTGAIRIRPAVRLRAGMRTLDSF